VLGACVAGPIPNEKIAVAKDSVQRAEQAGATEFAPVELSTARDKLKSAESAAADHQGERATMLAEQANVDAQLAEATAQEHRSHKAEMELQASLLALRQEASQNEPPPPAPPPTIIVPQPPTQ
jgi:hypothetical protein